MWIGMMDREAAMIARCMTDYDVAAAVCFVDDLRGSEYLIERGG